MQIRRHSRKTLHLLIIILLAGGGLAACNGIEAPLERKNHSEQIDAQAVESAPTPDALFHGTPSSLIRTRVYEDPSGYCGDGTCEVYEAEWCSTDCGYSSFCGDGYCSGSETCSTCAEDCGICPNPDTINIPGTPQRATMSELYASAQSLGISPLIASVPNIEAFLQSGYPGDTYAASYPTDSTGVQDFINKLFQRGVWQTNAPTNYYTPLPPDSFGCQRQQVTSLYNPSDFVTLDMGTGLLFPSALIQGAYINIGSGFLTPIHVPYHQRKQPVSLVGTFYATTNAPTATASDIYPSIGQMIQLANNQGAFNHLPKWIIDIQSASSVEEAAAKLRLDAKALGPNISTLFDPNTQSNSNTVVVKTHQSLFTVFQDLKGFTPALGQFNLANFTKTDLERLGDYGELGYTNLPTYVRAVTFGRMLIFSITSNSSKAKLEAAVNAVYNGGGGTPEQRQIIQDSIIRIVAHGGAGEPTVSAIKSGNLSNYFTFVNTPIASLKPIGYEFRRLDDQVATMSRTVTYEERACPGVHKLEVKLSEIWTEASIFLRRGSSAEQNIVTTTADGTWDLTNDLDDNDGHFRISNYGGRKGFPPNWQRKVRVQVFVDGMQVHDDTYSCKWCHSSDNVFSFRFNKNTGAFAAE